MQSVNDCYSAVQLRSDRWGALRAALETLAEAEHGLDAALGRRFLL